MGDPGDVAPTMAVGFTINHIAAVFLPAIGGYFWIIDYRIPFIAGAVMALVSRVQRTRARTLVDQMGYLELAVHPRFKEAYLDGMAFSA